LHHAVLGFRDRVRLERGDWDGAAADAETALAEAGDTGMTSVLPLLTLGRIQAARGNPAAGGTLERAAHAAEQVGDVSLIAAVADGLAEHWAWAGQDERARAEARSGMVAAGGDHGPEFVVGRLAYRLWRAGDRSPPPAVTAAPFLAMIEGRWAEAAAEWERRGATYLQAAALGQGDEPAADEALRTLTRLGAFAAAEHLRADLRRRGVAYASRGPRRVTSGDSAGLTPRQLDVLRAVAEGLSDADIADRLALSTKTVSHHMSAILRKLEVTSRGQAAAKAHRLGLAGREPG